MNIDLDPSASLTTRRLRVALFGVSGFGNPVLEALSNSSDKVELAAVFTPHFDEPFPYYEIEAMEQYCLRSQIACHSRITPSSPEGLAILNSIKPDLIVVSSFYEILRTAVLSIPTFGIVNIHPSLLPRFRGRHPTKSALLAGDTESGVTFHYLTETVDTGDILLQRRCPISDDETDSTLRMKLAALAGESIPELVHLFQIHNGKPPGSPQDDTKAVNCTKINYDRLTLETSSTLEICLRRLKALTEFPGAVVAFDGEKKVVRDFELIQQTRPDGIYPQDRFADFFIDGAGIRLFYCDI